jgi:hypothetical protein
MHKGLSTPQFLAINAKGGENIKPKAKGPHHHQFQNFQNKVLIDFFHIGIYVMEISSISIQEGVFIQEVNFQISIYFKNPLES